MTHFSIMVLFIISLQLTTHLVRCVTDVNLAHLQYLANNLAPGECRKFVASLYFNTFDEPNALQQAERKVLKDESCLQQLLHWNTEKIARRGTTHELLVRRLKQINRNDLALWLTNAAFNTMNKSLEKINSGESFQMYEPILLPYVNYTTRQTESTQPQLRVTTEESLMRIAKQNAPDPVEDIVVDPTEWTIFDTISWSIVIILFLLILVLLVYLVLASPCNRKKRCTCSPPPSPRSVGKDHQHNPPKQQVHPHHPRPSSSVKSSPVSRQRNDRGQETHPQRHFETSHLDEKSTYQYKKHPKDYASLGNTQYPAVQSCHCECGNPRCKRQQFSESPSYNDVGSYNPYEETSLPPAPRPICHAKEYNDSHSYHTGSRTIDIHQKIAIPMNSIENSN